MATRPWSKSLRTQAFTTYERLVPFRVKAGKLSLRNTRDHNRRCPHAEYMGSEQTTAIHTFWICPWASRQWKELKRQWSGVGVVESAIAAAATLPLQIPVKPTRMRDSMTAANPSLAHDDDTQGQVHAAAASV